MLKLGKNEDVQKEFELAKISFELAVASNDKTIALESLLNLIEQQLKITVEILYFKKSRD